MLNSTLIRPTALATAITVGLSGCTTLDSAVGDSSNEFACGAGAVAGAILVGGLVAAAGGDTKAITGGAAAGGALGCAAGYYYKQRVDRLKALAAQEGLQAQVRELELVDAHSGKTESVGVEAQVQVQEMFPSGSAELTDTGRRQLSVLAREFAQARENTKPGEATKKVLVVGHTDATGGAALNQRLSEARAKAVGGILAEAGIPAKDIYFQGAGASRPLADNTTAEGRAKNRRVEFVEVKDEAVLAARVREERNNPKYLAHGTAPAPEPARARTGKVLDAPAPAGPVATSPARKAPPLPDSPSATVVVRLDGQGGIDFGGQPVTSSDSKLAARIAPKQPSFSLVSSAYASAPVTSCLGDMPRMTGEVKNLATGATLADYRTHEFLPGLNGSVWASRVNGHVASIGPVGILRDEAQVAVAPNMQFISHYATSARKQSPLYKSVANTYEGETQVLYRVFALDRDSAPVSCMDIVFDKRAGSAIAGEMYYPHQGQAYVAQFQPQLRR